MQSHAQYRPGNNVNASLAFCARARCISTPLTVNYSAAGAVRGRVGGWLEGQPKTKGPLIKLLSGALAE
jgi:hypothetical protein